MNDIPDIEDLTKPKCAFPSYRSVYLKKDKEYIFCNCGHSKIKDFCDQTCQKINHNLKGFSFKLNEKQKEGKYSICLCKTTDNPPFCDGNHIYAKWSK